MLRATGTTGYDGLLSRRFISIEDDSALKGNKALEIRVKADPDAKTITIECACRPQRTPGQELHKRFARWL